jgi:biotin carboxylase
MKVFAAVTTNVIAIAIAIATTSTIPISLQNVNNQYFRTIVACICGPGSSVSGYGLDDRAMEVRSPAGADALAPGWATLSPNSHYVKTKKLGCSTVNKKILKHYLNKFFFQNM